MTKASGATDQDNMPFDWGSGWKDDLISYHHRLVEYSLKSLSRISRPTRERLL